MPRQTELLFANDKPLAENETPRTIALGDRIVSYVLRRAQRRTIGLSIDHRGLRVGAPRRTPLIEVESLILRHSDWVANKLDEWRNRRSPELLRIVDGTHIPLLGAPAEIRIAAGNNTAIWEHLPHPVLTLCLRTPEDSARVLEKTLRKRALGLFAERLAHYAQRFNLPTPTLSLSSARTRWGSCSLKTGIRLNWRLIHFSTHIIDYVVVHELAHLREMNHSARFWSIVEQFCPDYRATRNELKHQAANCPHW